jgi:hypothetical protein
MQVLISHHKGVMMIRLHFKTAAMFVSAVAVGGLAAGLAGPALGTDGSKADPRGTLWVFEKETETGSIDLGDEGFSIGDEGAVWTADLKRDGAVVGHDSGTCFVTSVEIPAAQCLITAAFDHGQITFQGVNDLTQFSNTAVITGGTGAYEGAEGIVRIRFNPSRGGHILRFIFSN